MKVISLCQFRASRDGLALLKSWKAALTRRQPIPAPPSKRERRAA